MPKPASARRGAAAAALSLLAGCAVGAAAPDAPAADDGRDARLHVVASFTVLADMTAEVAGDDVLVTSVTRPGSEIHGYEPTPDDLRRATGADLLLVNGLGLEGWVERLVEPLGLRTVVVTDGMASLPIADGDARNPHLWMSPRAGQDYVHAIAGALAEVDPAGAAGYAARAERYAARLERLHGELLAALATVPPARRLLVTCEGAFSYLARDAGMAEAYLWPVNAERQGTPRQVAAVIRAVRESDVPAVFCESTVAPTAQVQVARETGARFAGVLHVDSLTTADGPAPTYLDLLRHDVDVVVAGLTGEGS
ncbi:metal ABC transporter solute-binding protein, Zn/Mn family [Cellulomonas carbonis]|uniref:Iron-binding protein n=1 Tax=Cellulomonas carbonis T26 TaxID=947969 RepID=A0A0A0BV66_9CELL|nr:zinc ABC transporter substrate-binding protein [Cellulomonas carbonis]KGM11870.1 iron-binding protein [Cellulomonas carbonis T26]GGB91633.1 metal ABC transporter substrate-binding protein [Cellulomonas carbonis]